MSHTTTATATVSTPDAIRQSANATVRDNIHRTLEADYPGWAAATPMQQVALLEDAFQCCHGSIMDCIPLPEYIATLAEYTTAGSYLATLDQEPQELNATLRAECGDDTANLEPQEPAAQEPAQPTATLAQANRTLAQFGTACRTAADHNYRIAALAAQFVGEFLGASPGKATRSVAVDRLANEWYQWDEESMSTPQSQALTVLRRRVNLHLQCQAVVTLLGDGSGVAKGDGTAKGRGKGAKDSRLPWGKLRELAPLVYRQESDTVEAWAVYPSIAAKCQGLVAEIATSGLARADVVRHVAELRLEDAELELAGAQRALILDPSNAKAQEWAKLAKASVAAWKAKLGRKDAKADTTDADTTDAEPSKAKPKADTAEPAATLAEPTDTDTDAEEPAEEPAIEPAPKPEPAAESKQGANLLTAMAHQSPRALAESIRDLLAECEAPDTTLAILLDLVSKSGAFSNPVREVAADTAQLIGVDEEPAAEPDSKAAAADAAAYLRGECQDDDTDADADAA